MDILFWLPVMLAGAIAGSSTGLIGVYIVGMRIPFLGVCVSHSALAGAVFGVLLGLEGHMLIIPALISALLSAGLVGLIDTEKFHIDSSIVIGVLFSLTMGLAFLGIGLFNTLGRSDNDVRNLLWGSLNFCRWGDVKLMAAVAVVACGFIILFYKELMAIMFSRHIASASGINVRAVWSGFLALTALVLTISFQTVGGLMVYSLLVNPATAAFRLTRSYGRALILSALLGGFSGIGGFVIAALTDLPTGAVIVILSSLIVAISAGISYARR